MEMSPKSLLEMARGAFLERFDYEVPKIINNILDPNTKAIQGRCISPGQYPYSPHYLPPAIPDFPGGGAACLPVPDPRIGARNYICGS